MALVASLLLTGLVRKWAIKIGFTDKPGTAKIHKKPIAYGGGIGLYIIGVLPLLVAGVVSVMWGKGGPTWLGETVNSHLPGLANRTREIFLLFGCATALFVMGLIDDVKRLGAMPKLAVQVGVAIALVCFGGMKFDFFITVPGIAEVLSILWIIVIMNAFNFLDNMDGLSAGIAAISGCIILGAAWAAGQVFISIFLALLVGALIGFLFYNFNPASIFMGDAGSLLVGLFMSIATIRTTYYQGQGAWFVTLMPLIALAVPLYDFIVVVILRLMQGKSPFVGDTQHFSHRLVKRGMTQKQSVLTIWLATACTGLGATVLHMVNTTGMILIFIQTIMILLIIAILERPVDTTKEK
ncbi:MAG: undecaprenyl/decaprenyl-phosphate alpha-N-acetylglucosaminyl 1-phosphate transferase [Phycisphaerae bacterium]|nr:undecaprenyl/decaprenyl-phosphate alpha-N-acetylglucosaminyl 1-phosphate transferase [Phycisphaerae bacterium]